MDLVKLLEFRLLPVLVVEFWVQEVDPLFPTFDLGSAIAPFPEILSYLLPFLRNELGVQFMEQLQLLNEDRKQPLRSTSLFFCFFASTQILNLLYSV